MKEYSGRLQRLGSSTISTNALGKSFIVYDSIEIGNTILQKVRTARNLSDYVADGLGSEVTLYMNGKLLVGVKLSSGKVYYWKRSIASPLLMVIPAIMLGLVAGAITNNGLFVVLAFALAYFLFGRSDFAHVFLYQSRLSALGGAGLKS